MSRFIPTTISHTASKTSRWKTK